MTDVLDAPLDAEQAAVWTCDDIAAFLKCSRRKVDYLRKREDFPKSFMPKGSHPRFRRSDVIAFIESGAFASTSMVLYRHFDASGRLLYVGVSSNLEMRNRTHRTRSAWFAEVARTEVELFFDERAAAAAEVKAIRSEHPLHNIAHNEGV